MLQTRKNSSVQIQKDNDLRLTALGYTVSTKGLLTVPEGVVCPLSPCHQVLRPRFCLQSQPSSAAKHLREGITRARTRARHVPAIARAPHATGTPC
jgi:hypothetical protein